MSQKPGHVTPVDYTKLNALYDQFVPQKELSREHVYWLSTSDIASQSSDPPKPVTPFVHTRPVNSKLKDNITSLRIQNDGHKIEIANHTRRGSGTKVSRHKTPEKPKVLAPGMYAISSKYITPPRRGDWALPTPRKKHVARPKTIPKNVRKIDITVAYRIVPQWKPTGRQFILCDIYGPKKSKAPTAKPLELSP
nr:hypothetical protein [Tanacetum cinerariifolium]